MLGVGFVGVAATWVCFVGASCIARPAGTHFSPVALKAMGMARGQLAYSNSVWGRGREDNLLLALATDGNARYLVTGDSDLLVLNPYKDVQILNPATIMNLLEQ